MRAKKLFQGTNISFFAKDCRKTGDMDFLCSGHGLGLWDADMIPQTLAKIGHKAMISRILLALLTCTLLTTLHPAMSLAATEPLAPDPPAVTPIATDPSFNYFDLEVTYTTAVGADGVILVAKQSYLSFAVAPTDGVEYTANARMGSGDRLNPNCMAYCQYVVAKSATGGTVRVTGLKANTKYYFYAYTYNGTGADINYNQTQNPVAAITAQVPLAGRSHNEQHVASGPGGTELNSDCQYCHGGHHTADRLPRGTGQYDRCITCHNSNSATTARTKLNLGLHLPSSSTLQVDCGTCHSMHSWRKEELYSSTTGHAANDGFNLSFVRANMTKYANTTNGYTADALEPTVFQIRPNDYAFTSGPYDAVCQTCHTATTYNRQSPTGTENSTHYIGQDCKTCHGHKPTIKDAQYNAFRPGHTVGGSFQDLGTESPCTDRCHDASKGVLDGIHGNGTVATCSLCHVGTPTRDNERLGGSITAKSPAGDARWADGTSAAADSGTADAWSSKTCTTCHRTTDSTGAAMYYHDVTIAAVTPLHQLSSNSSGGYDCEACHSPDKTNEQLNTHMKTDTTVTGCYVCHDKTTAALRTTSIVAKTVINSVTFDIPRTSANTNNSKCENCHYLKGDYRRHGLTDDASLTDGMDNNKFDASTNTVVNHNNLGGSVGAWSTSGNTIPSYRKASYTGKIDYDTYGGLLAADYNCGDCHSGSISTKSFTTLRVMRVHTKAHGVGRGDCLTCHVEATSVADEINTGKGTVGTTVNCETCHSIANGNGPSGDKLYQYDGLRHHKTARAQAGDCSWCHADPRPATPVQGTWDGYNAYADTADSDGSGGADDATDGWATDYAAPTAAYTTPEQPGCYLCHTNATSYSVEVYGLNGLHGYNFNAGTAAQRTSGLTVWANNYDARAGSYPNRSNVEYNADPVTQTPVHRLEANDGASLIKAENLGACMACHSVQLHHAVPKPTTDYDNYDTTRYRMPWDVLRYGPGRSIFGVGDLFRGVDNSATAWDDHMMNAGYRQECQDWSDDCRDRTRNGYMREIPPEFSWGPGVSGDSQVVIPCNSNYNNFELLTNLCAATGVSNGGKYQANIFADFAAPAVDSVYITRAEWNGTDVNVIVYNKLDSGQTMRLSYSGGACTNAPVNLTWNTDHYEGTCTNPGSFTSGTDYVTVSNETTASTLDVRTRLVK